MRRFKEIVIGILAIAVIASLAHFMNQYDKNRRNRELARRIAELSPTGGVPQTIDALKEAIALYEAQIERNVKEAAQTGVYWKILGIRLADRKMHNEALAAFERAIYFGGEDPVLFNLTGVSAGFAAKDVIGFTPDWESERARLFRLSENGYLRALELDNTYAKPMYGLAVLYVFELNRPDEAIPYLERYMQHQSSDTHAMFVLARAHFMMRNFMRAIEVYEKIASSTKNQKIREEAYKNIETVRMAQYE